MICHIFINDGTCDKIFIVVRGMMKNVFSVGKK